MKQRLNRDEFKVFQPMPSPIEKLQNRYRWRIIVKGNMTEDANEIFNEIIKNVVDLNLKSTRISIDVNPNNMV